MNNIDIQKGYIKRHFYKISSVFSGQEEKIPTKLNLLFHVSSEKIFSRRSVFTLKIIWSTIVRWLIMRLNSYLNTGGSP